MCFGRGGCDFPARGGIPGMFWAMPFSFLSLEAFSAGNALLFSGIRKIRYRRGPPTVRNMRAVQKTGSWGTRRIFRGIRCKKQASTVQKRYSVPETPFSGTGHVCQHPKISGNRYCNRMGRRNVVLPKKISGVLDYYRVISYLCRMELRYGVMVALQILVLPAQVRILVPQRFFEK